MTRWRWGVVSLGGIFAHTILAHVAFGRAVDGREWIMWGWSFFLLIFVICLLAQVDGGGAK